MIVACIIPGILHKGDGTNIYLKEQPRKVVTVLGNGRQRRLDCRNCDGDAENSRLMAPVALASGRDGSLYVGDFNHIRKLSASRREVASILELRWVNSLALGKFEWNFGYVISKWILVIDGWGICCEIALIWMSLDFTDDQSTLVQVLACCHQATSHYLSQCRPRSLAP